MLDNLVRKDRCDPGARRAGACRLGLVGAGVCLATAAFAGAPRATAQPRPLISREYREYQAKTIARYDHAGPPRFAAVQQLIPSRRGGALGSATTRPARVKRYHAFPFQYQLHFEISRSNNWTRNQISTHAFRSNGSQTSDRGTGQAISDPPQSQTSISTQNLQSIHQQQAAKSGDERRLLQIGLALAIVYVVFLVLWFWGTREDGRRFEGAPRF